MPKIQEIEDNHAREIELLTKLKATQGNVQKGRNGPAQSRPKKYSPHSWAREVEQTPHRQDSKVSQRERACIKNMELDGIATLMH